MYDTQNLLIEKHLANGCGSDFTIRVPTMGGRPKLEDGPLAWVLLLSGPLYSPLYCSFWALLLGQSFPCKLKLMLVRIQRLLSGWTGLKLSLMLRKICDG